MVGAERRSILVWIRLNLTKTWLSLGSKQNLVFSPLLFFRFNEGKFKYQSCPFLFQGFKYGHKWFHTARLACLTLRTRSRMIDVNCQNWPITGYTSSLYTRKKYWKQCLQAHLSVFPQSLRGFRATFSLRMQIKVRDKSYGNAQAKSYS